MRDIINLVPGNNPAYDNKLEWTLAKLRDPTLWGGFISTTLVSDVGDVTEVTLNYMDGKSETFWVSGSPAATRKFSFYLQCLISLGTLHTDDWDAFREPVIGGIGIGVDKVI